MSNSVNILSNFSKIFFFLFFFFLSFFLLNNGPAGRELPDNSSKFQNFNVCKILRHVPDFRQNCKRILKKRIRMKGSLGTARASESNSAQDGLDRLRPARRALPGLAEHGRRGLLTPSNYPNFIKILSKSYQILAESSQCFASNIAVFSIFRNLQEPLQNSL